MGVGNRTDPRFFRGAGLVRLICISLSSCDPDKHVKNTINWRIIISASHADDYSHIHQSPAPLPPCTNPKRVCTCFPRLPPVPGPSPIMPTLDDDI